MYVCVLCTYVSSKANSLKGNHPPHDRETWKDAVIVLYFCLVTHVPLLKQMHHNVLSLFFQCAMILKLSQIIKYKWDVNYLSKHNKNIMQHGMFALNVSVRVPYEGLSKENLE